MSEPHQPTSTGSESPWVTRTQAAQRVGVTTRCIDLMVGDGRLKSYTLGPRIVRLRVDEVDAAFKPVEITG
jgi:excisionase family DNA binding protein